MQKIEPFLKQRATMLYIRRFSILRLNLRW